MRKQLLLVATVLIGVALVGLIKWHERPAIDRNREARPLTDLTIARDIAYAPGERQDLDVYSPSGAKGPRPVIVYIYGGRWRLGSKDDYAWVGAGLARRGYVAVVPEHRVYPPAIWPSFVEDGAHALAWVKANIARYGGDPAQVIVAGHSSGGFTAVSLAVQDRWLAAVGLNRSRDLRAVISLAGKLVILPPSGSSQRAIFAEAPGYVEMKDHVDPGTPPLLFLVGEEDRTVDSSNSVTMLDRVTRAGGEARLQSYSGLDHDQVQTVFGNARSAPPAPMWSDIEQFLRQQGVTVPDRPIRADRPRANPE